MTERDWNPDTGGRSLAEILREAGIESAQRSRRRGWNDPEETAIRQRRADAAAETSGRAGYARRRSDLDPPDGPADPRARPRAASVPPPVAGRATPPADPRELRRMAPDPSTSAIPGLRPDRKPGVPGAAAPRGVPAAPVGSPVAPATSATAVVAAGRQRIAERVAQRSAHRRADEAIAVRGAELEPNVHPHTGPIPVVHATGHGQDAEIDDDVDETPREAALAWLRFGGELLIALAAGVGIYFAARVLWEIVPYVAVLLVPVAVTGLVLGVGMWRRRLGHEPIGARLMGALVLAGTLLAVAPAAELLAAR